MPYNEAPPIIQNIVARRARLTVILLSAIAVLFVIFIAVAGVVLWNQNDTLSKIDDNTAYVQGIARQAVETSGGAKCRSRVNAELIIAIADIVENASEGRDPDPEQTIALHDAIAQSQSLIDSLPGEGPCDNVDENGYPIGP